jgi:phospholipid-translocating ATPase
MLTGDKLETAENIGYLCDLIDVQTKITRLTIENSSKTARRLDKLARKIDNFEE